MQLFEYIAKRIRDLRSTYGETGLSQEALAKSIGVAANTVSRWETGTYKPTLEDLEKLARFFGVSILDFFPPEEKGVDEPIAALLRAVKGLSPQDIDELRHYAEFRRARHVLEHVGPSRGGRKRKEAK